MEPAEAAVVVSPATGEQEQRHVNAEFLLKQVHHPSGLSQAAGPDRAAQALTGLITERLEQAIQPVFAQGKSWRDAADALKTEIKETFAGSNCLRYITNQQPTIEVH